MTYVPNVLLLTGAIPGSPHVGGIYLKDICLAYPQDRIACFVVNDNFFSPLPPELASMPFEYAALPDFYGTQDAPTAFNRVRSFFIRQYRWRTTSIYERIVAMGRREQVDTVWAVLNTPYLIHIARRVAQALNAHLLVTVWDPPISKLPAKHFDKFTRRFVLSAFDATLRQADKISVMSEEIGAEYTSIYHTPTVVMRHGIHENLRKPPQTANPQQAEFVIGYAGSLYAESEWGALIAALSSVDWQMAGRRIKIRFMGDKFPFPKYTPVNIEYLGWRSLEETIELLAEVDIAYLPYWFDAYFKDWVRLCFPTKLTTYLTAGRPVLYHGPQESSPAHFMRKYPIGVCCHSLQPDEILASIRTLMTDTALYNQSTQMGAVAIREELSLPIFLARFAAFMGITEGQLVPPALNKPPSTPPAGTGTPHPPTDHNRGAGDG